MYTENQLKSGSADWDCGGRTNERMAEASNIIQWRTGD